MYDKLKPFDIFTHVPSVCQFAEGCILMHLFIIYFLKARTKLEIICFLLKIIKIIAAGIRRLSKENESDIFFSEMISSF